MPQSSENLSTVNAILFLSINQNGINSTQSARLGNSNPAIIN